jgi:hypothetical protein
MKTIFIIILTSILSVFSFTENKPKLCINCKYYISDNNKGSLSKCSFFQQEEDKVRFLVNGIRKTEEIKHHYCYTARSFNNLCGEDGNMYVRKYKKRNLKNK